MIQRLTHNSSVQDIQKQIKNLIKDGKISLRIKKIYNKLEAEVLFHKPWEVYQIVINFRESKRSLPKTSPQLLRST